MRQDPIHSGYRPSFQLVPETKTDGSIEFNDGDINPGEERLVRIRFIRKQWLGDNFSVGTTSHFYEVAAALGEIEIVEIL